MAHVSLDPAVWRGFVDDACTLPPREAPLHDAIAAHPAAEPTEVVGSFVLRDTDLPLVRGSHARLHVVGTRGAGQVDGPLGLARRLGLDVVALELSLLDTEDLAANARRVVAAVDAAGAEGLTEDVTVWVRMPEQTAGAGWSAAADAVAEAGLGLAFVIGTPTAPTVAPDLAGWIDAALDRETAYRVSSGLTHPVGRDDQLGFLNVLLATSRALDGAPPSEVVSVLADSYANDLVALARTSDLAAARRWFTGFASGSVRESVGELAELGLLDRV